MSAKQRNRLVSKRELASFCGFAQSVRLAVMPANLFLHSLYNDCSSVRGWQGDVRLSRQSFRDLEWWANIPARHQASAIRLRPAVVDLFVDASTTGWGAVLPDLHDSADDVARGSWSPAETQLHINQLEMRAVRLALLSFAPVVSDRVVRLHEDNTVTQSVLGRFSSRSPALMSEYRALWAVLDDLHVQLQVVRVASADNLADAPSRLADRFDYRLSPRVFATLDALWGPHDMDLFASNSNTLLPSFYSLHRCPGTSGVNALLQPWHGLNGFANPPWETSILLQVVQKLREERASATLLVPCWPSQPWYHELMLLAKDVLPLPQVTFSLGLTGSAQHMPRASWPIMAVRVEHG